MTKPTTQTVLKLLNKFSDNTWVAGSAAIAPHKADDIDVYFLSPNLPLLAQVATPFGSFSVPSHTTYPTSDAKILTIIDTEFEDHKVQLIWSGHTCIHALLASFDVSCHAWAINKLGQRVHHPDATLPGEPIKFICPNEKSQARLEEFTKRYQLEADQLWCGLIDDEDDDIPF